MRGPFKFGDIGIGDLVGHRQSGLPGKEDELATVKQVNSEGVICSLKDTQIGALYPDDIFLRYMEITFMDNSLNKVPLNTFLICYRIKKEQVWQSEITNIQGNNQEGVQNLLIYQLVESKIKRENIEIIRCEDITGKSLQAIQAIKDSFDN